MKTEKKKGISLLGTLLLMGAVPLMVAAIFMIVIAALSLRSEVKSETFDKLEVAAESVDQYFAYDVIANGTVDYEEYADHEFIESVKEQNVELTLFEGDTRLITSLKNEDGSYNEGTKASDEVYAVVSKGENFTSEDVVINGVDYYVFYEPIYDGSGQFWGMAFAGTPQKLVKAAINKAVIQLVIAAAFVAIFFSIIITILAIRIRKSISLVASDLTKLSEGDLSVHIDISDAIIEVKDIINATNVLQSKLSEVIGGVKERTEMLSSSVAEVQHAANLTSYGTDQIATAMEELSTSTMTLTENVQSVNAQAIEMGNYIQGITENVDNLANASDEIKDATEKAQALMTQVLESSDQSASAVAEINESISLTNESIIKITDAVDFITSIAEQTNLLSLNAAIEAARAGEAGKGFAVVAEEIGKLATDSANTAGTIKDLASDMNDKSARTVELAGKIENIISEEKTTVGSTQEAFSTLGAAIEESLAMISEIDSKAGELLGIKDGIIGNISDLSSIAQENAASNQEIAASVTDISGRANDMSAQSDSMEALSEQLAEAVEYFK